MWPLPADSLALRRHDHAVQLLGIALEFVGCANVVTAVRRGSTNDFRRRNGNPGAVDLHLVVIVDRAAGRRTTVGEVAARAFAVGPLQGVVKTLMPLVVAGAEVALLCMSGKGSGKGQCEKQDGEPRTHVRSPPVKKPRALLTVGFPTLVMPS